MNRRGILKAVFVAPAIVSALRSAWARASTGLPSESRAAESLTQESRPSRTDHWADGILLGDLDGPTPDGWLHFAKWQPLAWSDGAPDVPPIPGRTVCAATVKIEGAKLKSGDRIMLVNDGLLWLVVSAVRITKLEELSV